MQVPGSEGALAEQGPERRGHPYQLGPRVQLQRVQPRLRRRLPLLGDDGLVTESARAPTVSSYIVS